MLLDCDGVLLVLACVDVPHRPAANSPPAVQRGMSDKRAQGKRAGMMCALRGEMQAWVRPRDGIGQ